MKVRLNEKLFFDSLFVCADRNKREPVFISPPDDYEEWVNRLPVPDELKGFLLRACLQGEDYNIGVVDYWSYSHIIYNNDEFRYILEAGFLSVASAINGDMVGIDWKKSGGNAGYLSHDALWVWDEKVIPNPYDYFLKVSDSIGEFVHLAADFSKCPIDFYGNMADLKDG